MCLPFSYPKLLSLSSSLKINGSIFSQTLNEKSGIRTRKSQFSLCIYSSVLSITCFRELKNAHTQLLSKIKQQETGFNYQDGHKKQRARTRGTAQSTGIPGTVSSNRYGEKLPQSTLRIPQAHWPFSWKSPPKRGFHKTSHATNDKEKNAWISPKTWRLIIQLWYELLAAQGTLWLIPQILGF